MTVLSRNVIFEGHTFALIKDKHDGKTFYGTIPYAELDERGRMKRALNGIQMRISWVSPADALNNRRIDVAMSRMLDGFMAQGMNKMEALEAMVATEEYANLYK